MFARLEIVRDKLPQVLAIPKAALQMGSDKTPQVFAVVDEVAFLRKVVPGLATDSWVEIKDGLKPGGRSGGGGRTPKRPGPGGFFPGRPATAVR